MKPARLWLLTLLFAAAPAAAQQHQHPPAGAGMHPMQHASPADSTAVIAAAEAFRTAIVRADRAALERVVLPTAVILEGGKTETRADYLGHHFGSDGAFLKAMTREPIRRTVQVNGHTAWIASISRLHGTYRDRKLDMDSAELLVLEHTPEAGWQVAAVHWSSRPRS